MRVIRAAILTLTFLTGGLVTSYAIAWWAAYHFDGLEVQQAVGERLPVPDEWPMPMPDGWPPLAVVQLQDPSRRLEVTRESGAMCEVRHYTAMHKNDFLWLDETRFGWPWRAAGRFNPIYQEFGSYVRDGGTDDRPWYGGVHLVDTTRPLSDWAAPVYFPLRPIWPGLIIDSTLYAGLLFGAYVFAAWVIREDRRRRGLCVRCKYPVGASPVCTECGTPIPHRSLATKSKTS